MEARIGRRKYRVFAFDIESHNDEESIAKQETSMWLGCLIDEKSSRDDETSFLYTMDETIDRLGELSTPKRSKNKNDKKPIKNIAIYVYNLSFEWSFLLPVLLKRGFKFKDRIEDDDEFVFNSITTKSVSSVWQIQIKFEKKSGIILFRDLSKIYGGGLGKVAKAFNLKTQKGHINYRKNRLHNYIVTQSEKYYCFDDCHIIIDILLEMMKRGDKDFWGACSMATYSMKKMIKCGWPRATKPYLEFRKMYPELNQEEQDFLRKGVGGGITYAPKNWQFKMINQKIMHIDAHQFHPSQAYKHSFPYGEGTYFKGAPTNFGGRNCVHVRVSYDDVKLHSVISLIGIDAIEDRELTLWDFELWTMKKVYVNLKIEYIDGYFYKMKPLKWRKYYAENYRHRLKAEEDKNDFLYLYFKLLNNASYGKLIEWPHNEIFENFIRDDGVIDSLIREKDEIALGARYTYIPVGSMIPAFSRCELIETALLFGWEKIVYFDTDSIFVIYDEKTQRVWDSLNQENFLGGWGLEEIIDRAQFAAPKRYKSEVNGKANIKMAGINFDALKREKLIESGFNYSNDEIDEFDELEGIKIDFNEVNIVNSSWRVQRAYRVKGGTLIEFQDKNVSIQKKYLVNFENNCHNELAQ